MKKFLASLFVAFALLVAFAGIASSIKAIAVGVKNPSSLVFFVLVLGVLFSLAIIGTAQQLRGRLTDAQQTKAFMVLWGLAPLAALVLSYRGFEFYRTGNYLIVAGVAAVLLCLLTAPIMRRFYKTV